MYGQNHSLIGKAQDARSRQKQCYKLQSLSKESE